MYTHWWFSRVELTQVLSTHSTGNVLCSLSPDSQNQKPVWVVGQVFWGWLWVHDRIHTLVCVGFNTGLQWDRFSSLSFSAIRLIIITLPPTYYPLSLCIETVPHPLPSPWIETVLTTSPITFTLHCNRAHSAEYLQYDCIRWYPIQQQMFENCTARPVNEAKQGNNTRLGLRLHILWWTDAKLQVEKRDSPVVAWVHTMSATQ